MAGVHQVRLRLLVEQHPVEGGVEVGLLLPVVRHDTQRAVRLLFERHAPFGGDAKPVLQLGVHLHQPVGFMSVRHGFQVRLDVLHADTFLLHIRQVYLRDVQRLELPLLLRLKSFGRVDTVIFQDLRVEVDADKFVQGILRHDEDTRVDGVLGLFHELFEEGFEG